MDLRLNGRVALITGSGRGIGQAAAYALAEEGVRIIVTDIDPEAVRTTCEALEQKGRECIGVAADVCNPEQIDTLADQAIGRFGKVDILINNAGFTRDKYLTKMPLEDWESVVDTILKGAFLVTKAVLPSMQQQRWGRIINISSRAHLGNPGQTNYAAAKAGLIGFTRSLALENGKFDITANAIAPGLIETPLTRSLPTFDKLQETALTRNPIPRLGSLDDIAGAILFLASDRAGFITGDTLHVTGGRYSS